MECVKKLWIFGYLVILASQLRAAEDSNPVGRMGNASGVGFNANNENETRARWTKKLLEAVQLSPSSTSTRKIDLDAIRAALRNHADIDAPGIDNQIAPRRRIGVSSWPIARTPLQWLAINADDSALAAMNLLLEHRAQVDGANESGVTPLMSAVRANRLAPIQLLLTAGANVYTRNMHGESAIFYAIKFHLPEISILDLLHRYGPYIANEKMDSGATPLHILFSGELLEQTGLAKVTEWFLTHGTDVNAQDGSGDTAMIIFLEMLRMLLLESTIPAAELLKINTMTVSILRLLMHAGADPKLANHVNETSYDMLARLRGLFTAEERQRMRLILAKKEHWLTYPWKTLPGIKRQLANELAADAAVDLVDEKGAVVELAFKDDLADLPPRPESVMGHHALAAAVAALDAAEAEDAARAASAQTVPYGSGAGSDY